MSLIFKDATRPLEDFILKILNGNAMTQAEILHNARAVVPKTENFHVNLAIEALIREGKIARDYDNTYQIL